MKKIITPVGTSLFENYIESGRADTNFKTVYMGFKNNKKRTDELDKEKNKRKKIEEVFNEEYFKNNINASAEIKSLIKIKNEKLKEDELEIYLLYSDTALGRLAAEIIKEFLPIYDEFSKAKIEIKKIENLQIWDKNEFKKGLINLILTIDEIAGGYYQNLIINITGGYKATIPYLTILAQVNRLPIYYIFEDTEDLIEIPYIPIDVNYSIFKKHNDFFKNLEREKVKEILQGITEDERKDIKSLLEEAPPYYSLNPLGIILWEKYKRNNEIFYISELVDNYIKDNQKKDIFEKSILELKRRYSQNPSDPDLNHGIKGVDLGNFKCFKHKENNLQVRILYRISEWETSYGKKEFDIHIGNIKIGNDVHNVESEYVRDFQKEIQKIQNTNLIYTLSKSNREVK